MNYSRPDLLLSLPPPRNLSEFKARQKLLLQAKREHKAGRVAYAAHTSTLAPTKFQAKAGKREHKHDALVLARHQAEAGPKSPLVPKPGKKRFHFVPYQAGQQIQLRSLPLRPVS